MGDITDVESRYTPEPTAFKGFTFKFLVEEFVRDKKRRRRRSF